MNRPIVTQTFEPYVVAVGLAATPLFPFSQPSDLINSFVLSLDAGAANNVFVGGSGVTIANGIEIVAGAGPCLFEIRDERMMYELMNPLIQAIRLAGCDVPEFPIPFVTWDMTQICAVAEAATNLRVATFAARFV